MSIPAKIIEIEGDMAKVSVGGSVSSACLMMIEDVNVGDYILVHAGFALEKIDSKEALKTLDIFKELEQLMSQD